MVSDLKLKAENKCFWSEGEAKRSYRRCACSAKPPASQGREAGPSSRRFRRARSSRAAAFEAPARDDTHHISALRSARLPVNLIGSPLIFASRVIGSPINSQSTAPGARRGGPLRLAEQGLHRQHRVR